MEKNITFSSFETCFDTYTVSNPSLLSMFEKTFLGVTVERKRSILPQRVYISLLQQLKGSKVILTYTVELWRKRLRFSGI